MCIRLYYIGFCQVHIFNSYISWICLKIDFVAILYNITLCSLRPSVAEIGNRYLCQPFLTAKEKKQSTPIFLRKVRWNGFYVDISWESRCNVEINVWAHFCKILLVFEVPYWPWVKRMPEKAKTIKSWYSQVPNKRVYSFGCYFELIS